MTAQPPVAPPTLDKIMADAADPPYTLQAFTRFLEKSHCTEPLDFIRDAVKYEDAYAKWLNSVNGAANTPESFAHMPLCRQWNEIVQTYIISDAPKEVNLPCSIRQKLADDGSLVCSRVPCAPDMLDHAVTLAKDLLRENSYIPFIQSVSSLISQSTSATGTSPTSDVYNTGSPCGYPCSVKSVGSSTAASSVSGIDRGSNSPSPVLSFDEQLAKGPSAYSGGRRRSSGEKGSVSDLTNSLKSKVMSSFRGSSSSCPTAGASIPEAQEVKSYPDSNGSSYEHLRKMSVKFKWKRSNSSSAV